MEENPLDKKVVQDFLLGLMLLYLLIRISNILLPSWELISFQSLTYFLILAVKLMIYILIIFVRVFLFFPGFALALGGGILILFLLRRYQERREEDAAEESEVEKDEAED